MKQYKLKSSKIFLYLLILIWFLLFQGCDLLSVEFENLKYKGTNIGVMNCVKKNKSEDTGTSAENIKRLCAKKHEKELYLVFTDGKAGFSYAFNRLSFSGNLINKSKDKIITYFEILIEYKDYKAENGKPISELIIIDNVWMPPKNTHRFEYFDLKFYPKQAINELKKNGRKKLIEKFNWRTLNFRGVDFVLK